MRAGDWSEEGGRCDRAPAPWSDERLAISASPIAVPTPIGRLFSALETGARSVTGETRTRDPFENVTRPIAASLGATWRNFRAAATPAWSRLGLMSVFCIDLEVSIAMMM